MFHKMSGPIDVELKEQILDINMPKSKTLSEGFIIPMLELLYILGYKSHLHIRRTPT